MRSRLSRIGMCLCAVLLLAACWDGRELEKRTIVLIIGIDRAEQGIRLSLQLARPQTLAPSGTAGAGAGEVVTVVTREAPDVSAALHELQLAVDRELFFGHTRVLLISEDVAREGVLRQMNPLYGTAALLPRTAWLFVVRGSAEAVLAHRPELDRIPSTYLTHFFENRILLQRPIEVSVGAFHRRWLTPGEEPSVLWIAPGQPDQSAPTLLGKAAFQEDRFVGGMDQEASKGWIITQNQPPPGRLPVACPDRPGTVAVRVVQSRNRMRARTRGNAVEGLVVSANVIGRIEGLNCRANLTDPAEIALFERAFREEILRLIRSGIRRAQTELQSDVFGFGKAAYRYSNHAWPGDERWREIFPDLPVRVEVTARLDYTGSYRETSR